MTLKMMTISKKKATDFIIDDKLKMKTTGKLRHPKKKMTQKMKTILKIKMT